jgi:hypothetical protein
MAFDRADFFGQLGIIRRARDRVFGCLPRRRDQGID